MWGYTSHWILGRREGEIEEAGAAQLVENYLEPPLQELQLVQRGRLGQLCCHPKMQLQLLGQIEEYPVVEREGRNWLEAGGQQDKHCEGGRKEGLKTEYRQVCVG